MRRLVTILVLALYLVPMAGTNAYAEWKLQDHAEVSISGSGGVVSGTISVGSSSSGRVGVVRRPGRRGVPVVGGVSSEGAEPGSGDITVWPGTYSRVFLDEIILKKPEPGKPGKPVGPTHSDVAAAVASGTARLNIVVPTPMIGPDPAWNEWHAVAVGFPIWLHVPQQGVKTSSVTVKGQTLTLTAMPGLIRFIPGDGGNVDCYQTLPYPRGIKPATPSPVCGYRYQLPGTHTMTATQYWTITYTSPGLSGTLTMTRTAHKTIPVIEIVSIVTG